MVLAYNSSSPNSDLKRHR